MANYQAPAPAPTADDPGKTLGIVGLVLAIVAPVVGIIVSAVALSQSKKAGFENKLAKIGLIVGIVLTVLIVVLYIVVFAVASGSGSPRSSLLTIWPDRTGHRRQVASCDSASVTGSVLVLASQTFSLSQAMSAACPSRPPGVSTTTGTPACRTTSARASVPTSPSPKLACRSAPESNASRESLACTRSIRPVIALTRSTRPTSSSPPAWAWQVSRQKPTVSPPLA